MKNYSTYKTLFNNKTYKLLNVIILLIYILFIFVYMFREDLYKLDIEYITLFIWVAPNIIPSYLFTLIGIFYVAPILFKTSNILNSSKVIWIINIINIITFIFIEYIHVIFNLGVWDNKDIAASLLGILLATISYFKFRKLILKQFNINHN